MTSKAPPQWMKFSPDDWQSDTALKSCSLAARGLWIEMIALMHKSPRYGHLIVGGRILDDAALAALVGAPTHEVSALLGDLEQAGVFTKSSDGAIYSRRMVRDHKRSNVNRKNGKKRWKEDNSQPPDIVEENKVRKANCNARKIRGNITPNGVNIPALETGELWPDDRIPESLGRRLVDEIGEVAYRSWFADVVVRDGRLIAPSRFKSDWIRDNYGQLLRQGGITEIVTSH